MPDRNRNIIFKSLLFIAIFIFGSCSNSQSKTEEAKRKEVFEEIKAKRMSVTELPPKISHRIKNGIRQAQLEEYIAKTFSVKFDTKFGKPFDTLTFDKVIAYDYKGDEETFSSVISRNGNFIPIIEKQAALNKTQVELLVNSILTNNSTYGGSTAACFNPHLGLVFYNNTKRVFVIDICLGCNYLTSTKDIPAMYHHKGKFDDGEEYPIYGFSKKGKDKIKQLAKELNLFYGE